MTPTVVNHRIAGTRITVWDVYHYLEAPSWSHQEIADILQLTLPEVEAAVAYIEEHKEEVLAGHREIEARIARGNPPEVEEKLKETRRRMQAWLEERQRSRTGEENGAGYLHRPEH